MAEPEYKRYVLDSYALIAYFEDEAGSEKVKGLLEQAIGGECALMMSVINLGEVLYIVERERGLPQAQKTLARIAELPINIVDADRYLTFAAAHIKAQCPIAYADCFAAALAQTEEAALLTGDPEFKRAEMDALFPIVWL
ncbi:MAG: type II toxin-antitoxin system VapC family toxin [Chloroflexi bacterium]|nr:type II toxin-antitoxin system VapC family toxin [Chloroflexota bacterium]MCL5076299.1 type II toxin-antitoxin system VapC family toxin [Chloroflexota bacterium]